MKKELKLQFLPKNVEYLARKSLMQLKHSNSIRGYIKQFTTLMLDTIDMMKKDRSFLVNGLWKWAKKELMCQWVMDLVSTFPMAKRLAKFNN